MYKRIKEKYNAIKTDYLSRSPKGKWIFVRNIGIWVLTLTGVPVLDPNYKVTWYSFAPGFTCMNIFVSFFYTVWYYSDSPLKGILVVPIFGVVIPVNGEYCVVIKSQLKLDVFYFQSAICYYMVMVSARCKVYQSLAFFAGERIYMDINDNTDPEYVRVCNESAFKLLRDILTLIGIVATSMIILLIFPTYALLFKNEIQLPIPVVLLFTDLVTRQGIIINVANQVFLSMIGGTGNIGIEIITCIMKNTVWAATVAICYAVDEISQFLESPKSQPKYFMDCKFRNILIQVQDLDR